VAVDLHDDYRWVLGGQTQSSSRVGYEGVYARKKTIDSILTRFGTRRRSEVGRELP